MGLQPGIVASLAVLGVAGAASAAGHAELTVCNARIDVQFEGPAPDLPRQALPDWIDASARAAVRYFGRFPVDRYRIRVVTADDGDGVRNGRTWGHGGAHTDVNIGR